MADFYRQSGRIFPCRWQDANGICNDRLKARKQRGKITVDDWNAAVVKAQDLKDQAECGELSDEELRRQLTAL